MNYRPLSESERDLRNRMLSQDHDLLPGSFREWLRRQMELVPPRLSLSGIAGYQAARLPLTQKVDTTTYSSQANNSENDLASYTLPGGTLSFAGESLEFWMAGTAAANANTKQVKVYFGGVAIFDTTALAFNNASWSAHGIVIRTGKTTFDASVTFVTSSALLVASTLTTLGTVTANDLSADQVLKATGKVGGLAATGYLKQELLFVRKNSVTQ